MEPPIAPTLVNFPRPDSDYVWKCLNRCAWLDEAERRMAAYSKVDRIKVELCGDDPNDVHEAKMNAAAWRDWIAP